MRKPRATWDKALKLRINRPAVKSNVRERATSRTTTEPRNFACPPLPLRPFPESRKESCKSQKTLGKQLTNEAGTAGAQRGADGKLLVASRGAREQEIGNVSAANEH